MKIIGSSLVLAAAMAIGALAVAQQQQAPAFDEVDTDRSGSISRTEAERSEQVEAAFAELDRNEDGQLSDEEYAQIEAIRTE